MNAIYLTTEDHQIISTLLASIKANSEKEKNSFDGLKFELNRAVIVEEKELPENVVRLNSTVTIRNKSNNSREKWTLTLPKDADSDGRKLSILAPIGSAIIGLSEGEEIEWETPGGKVLIAIESVSITPTDQVLSNSSLIDQILGK